MLVTIGKIEIITQTMTAGTCPPPNIEQIIGTIARIGIAWRATRYG